MCLALAKSVLIGQKNYWEYALTFLPFPFQVDIEKLDMDHAYIQITHVEPYFTEEELEERKTSFERNDRLQRFYFQTPFTKGDKRRGDVSEQWMHKTILTSKSSPSLRCPTLCKFSSTIV